MKTNSFVKSSKPFELNVLDEWGVELHKISLGQCGNEPPYTEVISITKLTGGLRIRIAEHFGVVDE